MDETRQIRFLIAPFYFFASLIGGAFLAGALQVDVLTDAQLHTVVALAALIIASALPLGFLIGSISILALRGLSVLWRWSSYEVQLQPETWQRLWPRFQTGQPYEKSLELYAAATFDHELLSRGVHEWLTRRWTAFNVAVHSCTALLLALLVGILLPFSVKPAWWVSTAVLAAVFILHARFASRDTMRMIDFQSHRQATPSGAT